MIFLENFSFCFIQTICWPASAANILDTITLYYYPLKFVDTTVDVENSARVPRIYDASSEIPMKRFVRYVNWVDTQSCLCSLRCHVMPRRTSTVLIHTVYIATAFSVWHVVLPRRTSAELIHSHVRSHCDVTLLSIFNFPFSATVYNTTN